MPRLDKDIFLIAALRTPIGKFGGALASMTAPQLGVASAKATIESSGIDPAKIDEVVCGNARQEQDEFAIQSQKKAERAYTENRFAGEIVPLEELQRDEHPRFDTDLGSLAKLPPVFRKNGSVHAGNSSGVTDGASSMIVASKAAVERHGLTPMARIVGYAAAGVDPKVMGIGPVPATR